MKNYVVVGYNDDYFNLLKRDGKSQYQFGIKNVENGKSFSARSRSEMEMKLAIFGLELSEEKCHDQTITIWSTKEITR